MQIEQVAEIANGAFDYGAAIGIAVIVIIGFFVLGIVIIKVIGKYLKEIVTGLAGIGAIVELHEKEIDEIKEEHSKIQGRLRDLEKVT